MMTSNKKLLAWVKECQDMCEPDQVYWCDGSQEENDRLFAEMVASGMATPLNPETAAGTIRLVVVPSPSWPKLLFPQQRTAPPIICAQVCR